MCMQQRTKKKEDYVFQEVIYTTVCLDWKSAREAARASLCTLSFNTSVYGYYRDGVEWKALLFASARQGAWCILNIDKHAGLLRESSLSNIVPRVPKLNVINVIQLRNIIHA